jgi:transcriptional regulator with XRE-family HTH domain
MHDRLKQFLTMEGLSPARFAEVMGIQRSGISHLLSGRNKPSFEFLEKMMTAYPDINPEWLILGKGRPYKSGRPEPEPVEKTDLFTEMPESVTTAEPSLIPEQQHLEEEKMPEQRVENRIFDAFTAGAQAQSVKKIARIIVFFNDGTYEEK